MGILWRFSPFPYIALLDFSEIITSASVEPYLHIARALRENGKIAGVVLRVNSGGGSAAATENLYFALRALADVKPLFCYVSEVAASGGYWLACSSQKIFAPATSLVGSIGVISLKPSLGEAIKKLGISLQVTKKGRHKDMYLFHRKYTREEQEKMEELGEAVYERFCEVVGESRRLDKKKVESLATGEVFSARCALSLGLIDGISSLDAVLDAMYIQTGVKKGRILFIRPRPPMVKRLVGWLTSSVVEEIQNRLLFTYR